MTVLDLWSWYNETNITTLLMVENIFAIESYLKKMNVDKGNIASLKEYCGIDADLDTIPWVLHV